MHLRPKERRKRELAGGDILEEQTCGHYRDLNQAFLCNNLAYHLSQVNSPHLSLHIW